MATASAALRSDISAQSSGNFTRRLADRELKELEEWLLSGEARSLPLHEVEAQQENRMREVNRLFLKAHI